MSRAAPGSGNKVYKEEVLGKHVEIKFNVDGQQDLEFFRGQIWKMEVTLLENGSRDYTHFVVFEDGEEYWLDLQEKEATGHLKWAAGEYKVVEEEKKESDVEGVELSKQDAAEMRARKDQDRPPETAPSFPPEKAPSAARQKPPAEASVQAEQIEVEIVEEDRKHAAVASDPAAPDKTASAFHALDCPCFRCFLQRKQESRKVLLEKETTEEDKGGDSEQEDEEGEWKPEFSPLFAPEKASSVALAQRRKPQYTPRFAPEKASSSALARRRKAKAKRRTIEESDISDDDNINAIAGSKPAVVGSHDKDGKSRASSSAPASFASPKQRTKHTDMAPSAALLTPSNAMVESDCDSDASAADRKPSAKSTLVSNNCDTARLHAKDRTSVSDAVQSSSTETDDEYQLLGVVRRTAGGVKIFVPRSGGKPRKISTPSALKKAKKTVLELRKARQQSHGMYKEPTVVELDSSSDEDADSDQDRKPAAVASAIPYPAASSAPAKRKKRKAKKQSTPSSSVATAASAHLVTPEKIPPRKRRRKPKKEELVPRKNCNFFDFETDEIQLKDFEYWLRNIHKSARGGDISAQNIRNVMKQVRILVAGEGITYRHWASGIRFYPNVAINLTHDFPLLHAEAKEFIKQHGRDKSNGWLLTHPIKKLQLYKEEYAPFIRERKRQFLVFLLTTRRAESPSSVVSEDISKTIFTFVVRDKLENGM